MSTGINIEIGANGATAAREIRKVGSEIRGLGSTAKSQQPALSGTFVEMAAKVQLARQALASIQTVIRPLVGFLTDVVDGTSQAGDQMAKMARNVGLSADALQTLHFAAGRSGVETSALNNGLKRLSRNMLDSITGNTRMADTFEAIGVKVQNADGSLRNVEDVFRDLSNVSASLGESAEGTGLRMLLLGRAGAELGNLMSQGSGGVDAMQARLDQLGGRMSGELLAASENYQDALLDLDIAMSGIKNRLAEELIPEADKFVTRLTDMAVGAQGVIDALNKDEGGGAAGALGKMGDVLKWLNPAMLVYKVNAEAIGWTLGKLEEDGKKARAALAIVPNDSASSMDLSDTSGRRAAVAKALSSAAAGSGGRGSRGPDPAAEAERAAEAEQRRADTVAAQIRAMERRMELSTADAEAQIRLSATFEEQDIARRVAAGEVNAVEAEHLRILNEQRTMLDLLDLRRAESAEAARVEADAAKKLHDEEAQRIRDLMALDEQRAQHRKQVAQSSVEAVTGILALGADIAGDIYDSEAKKNKAAAKEAFEARRIFLISQTIIGGLAGSINAIASAPNYIVGAIQAGLVAAQTVAAVAGIAAGKPSSADAGMLPTSLRDTHQSVIKRNDEMIVDPRGTRDVSAMFAMMRRQMEIGQQDQGGQITTHVVLDGEVVATSVERRFVDRAERGNDYRKRIRV
jgi:hypothetical protein